MIDIAKKVGVSTVSVHNALTGKRGVSDDIRNEILKVAKEMGYQQVSGSGNAEDGELKNICVIISEKYLADYDTFYWKLYQDIALAADVKNCMVTMDILKHSMEEQFKLPRIVEQKATEGIIVLGEINKEYICFLKEQVKMPIVFLDFYDDEIAQDAVITENFYGMYLMTEYLIKHGFNRLAYVGSINATSSIMDRYCGFYKAIIQNHIPLKEEWIIEDRDETGNICLEMPKEMPEAFVCNCDLVAGMLITELEKLGYRVPEDISVVGFDNYIYPGLTEKKITTYEVNMKAMAKVALTKVLKQLKNPNSGRGLDVIAGKIIYKESVKERI